MPAWARQPKLLRRGTATVRQHAVLLCRFAGLRNAAIAEAPSELGGSSFVERAAAEMERLVTLTEREQQERCAAVPAHLQREQGFDVRGGTYRGGAWIVGLFRVWLRDEGARLLGVTDCLLYTSPSPRD